MRLCWLQEQPESANPFLSPSLDGSLDTQSSRETSDITPPLINELCMLKYCPYTSENVNHCASRAFRTQAGLIRVL